MTDLPDGLYHLAGEEAESLWNWWLYEFQPDPDPSAYGIAVDDVSDWLQADE